MANVCYSMRLRFFLYEVTHHTQSCVIALIVHIPLWNLHFTNFLLTSFVQVTCCTFSLNIICTILKLYLTSGHMLRVNIWDSQSLFVPVLKLDFCWICCVGKSSFWLSELLSGYTENFLSFFFVIRIYQTEWLRVTCLTFFQEVTSCQGHCTYSVLYTCNIYASVS
jgi:hypothetical protein